MVIHLAGAEGVLLRRVAHEAGYDDNYLRREVRAKRLVRIRQGVYVVAPVWHQSDSVDRHRLLSLGVMMLYGDDVALSHTSACIEQGGPSWGLPLDNAHLTSLYGIGERTAAHVTHHRGRLLVDDVTRNHGHWITSPTRTALDTASISPRDAAVCVLDWFQQQGLTDRASLERGFTRMKDWPDTLALHMMLHLSDGRAESVGETRTRLLLKDAGMPVPTPQVEIRHPSGLLAGRVDFAWPSHRLMLEFDGRSKYLRHRRPNETLEQSIFREKAREDLLRELTGWFMIRLVWADLEDPVRTANRIRRALERSAAA